MASLMVIYGLRCGCRDEAIPNGVIHEMNGVRDF